MTPPFVARGSSAPARRTGAVYTITTASHSCGGPVCRIIPCGFWLFMVLFCRASPAPAGAVFGWVCSTRRIEDQRIRGDHVERNGATGNGPGRARGRRRGPVREHPGPDGVEASEMGGLAARVAGDSTWPLGRGNQSAPGVLEPVGPSALAAQTCRAVQSAAAFRSRLS